MLILSCRGLSWDESLYKDPRAFKPERFLPPDAEPHPVGGFFGFGRRCAQGIEGGYVPLIRLQNMPRETPRRRQHLDSASNAARRIRRLTG